MPRQLHNQPEQSHQHQFLVDLWQEVRRETAGAVEVSIHANNAGVAGSDPKVLEMLVGGDVEFATMMGPLIANLVPAAEIQGVPFAFRNSQQAHAALDGALGDFLRKALETRGIYLVPRGTLENGFRQICSVSRRVRGPDDLAGYRMRVPAGRILADLFEALGATPVTVNIDGLRAALKEGRVDGHENPLAIVEANRLHELTGHVCMTNHVWSGFNLIANLGYWRSLSADAQDAIHRAARTHVARQRAHTMALNLALAERLKTEHVDTAPFRARIGAHLYARWRERCGTTAWRLLRDAGGTLD